MSKRRIVLLYVRKERGVLAKPKGPREVRIHGIQEGQVTRKSSHKSSPRIRIQGSGESREPLSVVVLGILGKGGTIQLTISKPHIGLNWRATAMIATGEMSQDLASRTKGERRTWWLESPDCFEQFKSTIRVGSDVPGPRDVWCDILRSGSALRRFFSWRNLKYNEARNVNIRILCVSIEVYLFSHARVARRAKIPFH